MTRKHPIRSVLIIAAGTTGITAAPLAWAETVADKPVDLNLRAEAYFSPGSQETIDVSNATFTKRLSDQQPLEVSFAASNLKSYTEGLPSDFVQAERNLGQVDPGFEPEKPILWLKVRFDQENTLRSRISDLF